MKTHLNPKIYEIALQAGGSYYPEVNSAQLNTFAQLLIKECMHVAVHHGDTEPHELQLLAGQCLASALIAEHFGVSTD